MTAGDCDAAVVQFEHTNVFSSTDEVENLFIETFESAEEFLKNFKAKEYDLLVFDICLKKMNGVEAARAVRKKDEDVALVFLTSSRDFLLDGYGVFAADIFGDLFFYGVYIGSDGGYPVSADSLIYPLLFFAMHGGRR